MTSRQILGACCAFWIAAGGQFLNQHHGDLAVMLMTGAVAAALTEGISPAAIGEALTLATNQLLLRDHGRAPRDEVAGKPLVSEAPRA